jgi:hypothetical protein
MEVMKTIIGGIDARKVTGGGDRQKSLGNERDIDTAPLISSISWANK